MIITSASILQGANIYHGKAVFRLDVEFEGCGSLGSQCFGPDFPERFTERFIGPAEPVAPDDRYQPVLQGNWRANHRTELRSGTSPA